MGEILDNLNNPFDINGFVNLLNLLINYLRYLKFFEKNHGYITTKEIENIGISKTLIPELINQKILRKVAYGIYIDNNLIEDEFYILQKKFSNIVFSYNTACYLLNLSDRAPYKIDITTINHNNINENLNIHYVSKDKFNIGITEIESPYSNPIEIYSAERCICDLLKNPNAVDLEVYNKILNNYFKQKNKDLTTLEEYSKIFNVQEKFEHIMEVLI